LVKAKIILSQAGTLKASDPLYGLRKSQYHAVPIDVIANNTYVITHMQAKGDEFDPYLYLEDPAGKIVAQDDDGAKDFGGGRLDSRIRFVAPQTGKYRIIVTALQPAIPAEASNSVGGSVTKGRFGGGLSDRVQDRLWRENSQLHDGHRQLWFCWDALRLSSTARTANVSAAVGD
jgi:hypothetical protein